MTAAKGQFPREIDAVRGIFEFLAEFVDGNGIDEKDAFQINLVVEELFTNLVRHNEGGGDSIELSIERMGDRVLLELIDTDVEPFDASEAEVPPIDAAIEERSPGGLGLHLVRKIVDDLIYDYEIEGRRMRVSVTKPLEN